jgi:hypothetical protein
MKMDDKELLKRMMLAYVCLEGLELTTITDSYFEEQFANLRNELKSAIITKFSTSKHLKEELDNLSSRYRWDFLEFKQRVLGE